MKRQNHTPVSKERINRLQIVPWFNKKEWQETYENAYSSDKHLQELAYTQMCIWKIRFPNLPLGVECTMSMLHVLLCDTQVEGTYTERDLQLLYSTAVMRFLNQLTVMSSCKDSMYKMAEEHKIPDWLINLRHEAAHGNSVPALYLLRQASDIIRQWLKEHYWEAEESIMSDVVKDESKAGGMEAQRITEMLELWFELKINEWRGVKTVDKIVNAHFRDLALKIIEEEKCGTTQLLEEFKNIPKNHRTEENMEVDEERLVYTCKIKTLFEPFLKRLFEPLKRKKHRLVYQKGLIECLVKYKGFCPLLNLNQLGEGQTLQVMSVLGDLWKEVVEALQLHQLLPQLMSALRTADHDLSSAHLWLRLLTQLLAGDPPPYTPATLNTAQLLADSLPCSVTAQMLFDKAKVYNAKHHKPITLKHASPKEAEVLQRLAKDIIESPTKFTSRYLNSLLVFWEPTLSPETRQQLTAVAQIYCVHKLSAQPPSQVYTVTSLQELGMFKLSMMLSAFLNSLLVFWEPTLSPETRQQLTAVAQIYCVHKLSAQPPSQVYTVTSLQELGMFK